MYGKIFESMYDGTLYGQWEAIITFQQMIVLADKDGFVDITPPALAARTSIPLEIIQKGIEILESEDPYSRTSGQNGKRIELITDDRPWGWQIINYKKYRDMASREDKLRNDRERMAEKRAKEKGNKNKGVANSRNESQPVVKVAYVDVDTDVNKDNNIRLKFEKKVSIPKGFCLTKEMKTYADGKNYVGDLDDFTEYFILTCEANPKKHQYQNWYAAWQKWLKKDMEWHPEHKGQEMVDL